MCYCPLPSVCLNLFGVVFAWIASIYRCSLSQVCTSVLGRQTPAVYCFSCPYSRSDCKLNFDPVVCLSLFPARAHLYLCLLINIDQRADERRKEESDWCSADGSDGSSANASAPHSDRSAFPLIEAIAYHSLNSFLFQNNFPLWNLSFLFHCIWGVSSGTFFFSITVSLFWL